MKSAPHIIGLAGTFASGKDTLAHHLVEKYGYLHVSTGDIVRVEAQRQRGSIERPVLFEVANMQRHKYGAGYFAKQALAQLDKHPEATGILVTGLRSLGEARAIVEAGGVLVFVDAPIEARYDRMKNRQRDQEVALSLDEFRKNEAKEWHAGDDEADFNLGGIRDMATVRLENTADLQTFLSTAEAKLSLSE